MGGGSDVLEVFRSQESGVGHLGREALIKPEEFLPQFLHQTGYLEGVRHPGVTDEFFGQAVRAYGSWREWLV